MFYWKFANVSNVPVAAIIRATALMKEAKSTSETPVNF
jgi:hypothetical protein